MGSGYHTRNTCDVVYDPFMKLYTKRGDDGGTDLFGGQRVGKDHLRVEAYGTVDELNSTLGLAASACGQAALLPIQMILLRLQPRLFDLGSDLASPRPRGAVMADAAVDDAKPSLVPRIGPDHHRELEKLIDEICTPLPPMRHFIMPGGTEASARLHLARTVCRRAERLCVALAREESIGPDIVIYLNRLSDLLFALARRANQLEGVADVPWKPRESS